MRTGAAEAVQGINENKSPYRAGIIISHQCIASTLADTYVQRGWPTEVVHWHRRNLNEDAGMLAARAEQVPVIEVHKFSDQHKRQLLTAQATAAITEVVGAGRDEAQRAGVAAVINVQISGAYAILAAVSIPFWETDAPVAAHIAMEAGLQLAIALTG